VPARLSSNGRAVVSSSMPTDPREATIWATVARLGAVASGSQLLVALLLTPKFIFWIPIQPVPIWVPGSIWQGWIGLRLPQPSRKLTVLFLIRLGLQTVFIRPAIWLAIEVMATLSFSVALTIRVKIWGFLH